MNDRIVYRGPARRNARRRLHRGAKQLGVGSLRGVQPGARGLNGKISGKTRLNRYNRSSVGPPRGVQLGVVGLLRGVSSSAWELTVACSSAWGRTVAYISSAWGDSVRRAVGSSGVGRRGEHFLRVSLEG